MAIEAELPDGRILEFPDGTDPRVVQATVRRVLGIKDAGGGIGTVGGFFRGLATGPVNLLETAAAGAASVLPEGMEKSARQAIRSTAEAARRPFQGAPGEENTVGRKFGEAVSSTAPFFLLGPLGVAGRLGAAGLGVAAGAGEARMRAEEGGATEGQRTGSTLLGAAVGATEMLPVFAFLNRLGADGAGVLNILRRAAVTGGQEGLQEAAANVAQNLIAKGLYDPNQGVFTDTGEALGYGAGTGALISALTDLVRGRRVSGTMGTPEQPAAPAASAQPAPTGPAGPTEQVQEPVAVPGVDLSEMSAGQLYIEEARLSRMLDEDRNQPEVVARLREVRRLKQEANLTDAEAAVEAAKARAEEATVRDEEAAREAEMAAQSIFSAPELPEVIPREGFEAPEAVTRDMLVQAGMPAKPKSLQQKRAVQWLEQNVVGRSPEEVQAILDSSPDIVKNIKSLDRILRTVTTRTPPPFDEAQIGRTADLGVPEPTEPVAGGREPSVGVPSGVSPVGSEAVTPTEPPAPVGTGVAPTQRDAAPGVGTQGTDAAPVSTPATAPRIIRATEVLQPFVAPERATVKAERALQPYVARMTADQAAPEAFPRYMGWDALNGSTFDPQTGAITDLKFKPEEKTGVSAKQAQAAYEALTPEAQQQVRDEAQRYFQQEARAAAAREPMDREQAARAAEPALDIDELDLTEAEKEALAEYKLSDRPTVTETKTGRRVQGIRYQQAAIGEEVPLSNEVLTALRDGDISTALLRLSEENHPVLFRQLAARLSPLLVNTKVKIVTDLRNTENEPVAGSASTSGLQVQLDDVRGLNVETLLHEAVHAASERIIAAPAAKRTGQQNVAVRELNALWEEAKADPDMVLGTAARGNLSEFVTEALTNTETIKQLQARKWKRASMWEGFKRILLDMIGVRSPQTMAEAAIAAMDTIFVRPMQVEVEGTRYQLAPNVEAALRSQDTRQSRTTAAMVRGAFGNAFGVPGAINKDVVDTTSRIRTRLSDKAATVFDEITGAVNRGMMAAMDAKVVKALFKQAEAADQLIPEFMRQGGLGLDAVTGLWKVKRGANAPVRAIEMVEAWGKKNGLKFDDAWEYAARLIESGRQHAFREYNATRPAGTPALPTTRGFPIDELYAAYRADADLLAIKDVLDAARFELIDNMVAVGRLSAQEGIEWKAASEYIPFDRLQDFDRKLKSQKRVGRGLGSLGRLPELVDASVVDRPVGNALENYFSTLGWMVQQTVRTDALNKTLKELDRIGVAKWHGRNLAAIRDRGRAVHGYRHGKEVWYEVPSIYHAAAFNAATAPLPKFLQVFGSISRVLRTSITALPTFTAAQLPQDIQRAIMYSGVKNPAALTAKALSTFAVLSKHALKGTLHTATREEGEFGIVGDVDFRTNDPAKSILEELGYADRKLMGSSKAGALLHRLNELSRASDIAIRKAIYEQTLEETNDKTLALQRAREIINFRTTGMGDPLGILPVMIQTIPFFNAYVQGTDVLYRALTGRESVSGAARAQALKKFYTMAGTLAAGSTAYALMMAGDDEWENMGLEERDRSWIIGPGITLPVPTEIGMIFKAIPERVVDAMTKQGTPDEKAGMLALSGWFRAAAQEYFGRTVPIPAAVKPVLEAWTNYSFRTGRQIEGVFQQGLDADQRVNSNTSEFAKEVARFAKAALGLEISPIKIDNTLNGYFGTTAALTMAATDGLLNPNRTDRPLHQMVGLTPFTYDPVGNRKISEFYDLREKVVNSQNTLNMLTKQDLNKAAAYVDANKERLLMYKAVNKTLEQLQVTRQYKQWLDTAAAAEQYSSAERMKMKQEAQKWEQGLVEWTRSVRKELNL